MDVLHHCQVERSNYCTFQLQLFVDWSPHIFFSVAEWHSLFMDEGFKFLALFHFSFVILQNTTSGLCRYITVTWIPVCSSQCPTAAVLSGRLQLFTSLFFREQSFLPYSLPLWIRILLLTVLTPALPRVVLQNLGEMSLKHRSVGRPGRTWRVFISDLKCSLVVIW